MDTPVVKPHVKPQKHHLGILDILRAVAALAVCFFHFNPRNGTWGSQMLEFGHYGVEVFFIISGFIIPLAMYWSRFQYRDIPRFLIRRVIRLYPVFAIVATAHLLFSAYGFPLLGYGGGSPDLTWSRALANFTLTCNLVGEDWYLPIFWTLAIEAQYYLVMVVTFPLMLSEKKWVSLTVLLLWILPPYFVGYGETIFTWTAFFAMGILVFLKKEKRIGTVTFFVLLAMAACVHETTRNFFSAGVGVVTALLILYLPRIRMPWMEKIGVASYSLYLLHLIFGSAAIILIKQLPDSLQWAPLTVGVAMAVSIGSAFVFYRYLELPFHQWARQFKTRSREKELALDK
jgi:peptidoglycan/LPS O-acetylase OafA/YrhL